MTKTREPGAGKRATITAALQSYAGRGVFRGFDATPGLSGRTAYQFLWLTRRPMVAVSDVRARTLTFPDLFPHAARQIASDLRAAVEARTTREPPRHKRIDGRRARAALVTRRGNLTLRIAIRGTNDGYAVQAALNLINDLFIMLHEHYPEYLVQQFGVSSE